MRLIIIYAIILHVVWSVALFTDPAAGGVTAIHAFIDLLGPNIVAGIYLIVASMALIGMYFIPVATRAFYLLPQQFVMLISAGGALYAMITAKFADGVLRPHAFLIADQAPAVIAALLHTIAIIAMASENGQ